MIRWRTDPPNCHLFAPHPDNPFSDTKNYIQPAIAWDAEFATLSLATGYALHRWTHAPAWLVGAVPIVAYSLGPHVRGYLRGQYPISLHWVFGIWDRATPAFWLAGHRHDTDSTTVWRNHVKAAGEWLAGYALTACWDR